MAYNLKQIMAEKPSRFTAGHRMCAGCGAPVVGRMVLRALKKDDHAVISCATGCMEVSTFIYPYTAWTDSFIHTAFECTSATASGVEAAYKSLKRQGKLYLPCGRTVLLQRRGWWRSGPDNRRQKSGYQHVFSFKYPLSLSFRQSRTVRQRVPG